jgi:hypothetical protein
VEEHATAQISVSTSNSEKKRPKKKKLGRSEGKNHSILGSGPSFGVDLSLLLLVSVPEADFLLLVDNSGPGGSSMGLPVTNQMCTWWQNFNSGGHRLRFEADLPNFPGAMNSVHSFSSMFDNNYSYTEYGVRSIYNITSFVD